jgi:hypothetical protein
MTPGNFARPQGGSSFTVPSAPSLTCYKIAGSLIVQLPSAMTISVSAALTTGSAIQTYTLGSVAGNGVVILPFSWGPGQLAPGSVVSFSLSPVGITYQVLGGYVSFTQTSC